MTIMPLRVGAALCTVVGLFLGGCQAAETSAGVASAASPAASAAPNGVEALTAEQMLDRSRAALKKASSFHSEGYQNVGELTVFAEYQMVDDDLSGTIKIRIDEVTSEMVTAQFISVDGRQYLKPDRRFWSFLAEDDPETAMRVAGGRWIGSPVTKRTLAAMFSAESLVRNLDTVKTPYKGAPSEVDGLPVFTMGDRDDTSATILVAAAGEPYPVDWFTDGGRASLTGIGAPAPEIEAPPADDVIDVAELAKAGGFVDV